MIASTSNVASNYLLTGKDYLSCSPCCSSLSDKGAPALFELKMQCWLLLSSPFPTGSALLGNYPWLKQFFAISLTSFLLVYCTVPFPQCRAQSFTPPWIFMQYVQCSPPDSSRRCQCLPEESPSDGGENSSEVFRVPNLRSVLQTSKNPGIYCQKIYTTFTHPGNSDGIGRTMPHLKTGIGNTDEICHSEEKSSMPTSL